jgi:hypothetical protein
VTAPGNAKPQLGALEKNAELGLGVPGFCQSRHHHRNRRTRSRPHPQPLNRRQTLLAQLAAAIRATLKGLGYPLCVRKKEIPAPVTAAREEVLRLTAENPPKQLSLAMRQSYNSTVGYHFR